MLEIRNDDGSINRTIFPVAIGSICNIMNENVTFTNCTSNLINNSIFPFDTTVEAYGNPAYDTYVPLYQSKGMGYTVRANTLPNNATTKANPYIWFSHHLDEPEFATQEQIISDDYNDSKAMFPNKLVIMNNWRDVINFAPYYNIFMNDAYVNAPGYQSWCDGPCFTRAQMSYGQEALISGSGGIGNGGYQWNNSIWTNKSYWLQINAQAYSNSAVTNPITEIELRNLVWTSIASGVQGIAFWGYLPYTDWPASPSGVNGLSSNITIFNYYKNISSEIMSLNDILILPTKTIFWYTDKNTSYTNITPNPTQSIYWKNINNITYITKQPNPNTTYVIAVNKDANPTGNVQIKIGGITGTKNVTFLGNATSGSGQATSFNVSQTITATNGVFNDTFDGYAVHIYEISNATAGEGESSTTWTISGSGGDATWSGYSSNNVTEDLGSHGVKVGVFADNFNDGNYNGWSLYQYWAVVNATDGIWSASNGYLGVSGGTTSKWHGMKYNLPLQQNISVLFDTNITGSEEFASLFWDVGTSKEWVGFIDINDAIATNYHLRYKNGSLDTQVIENLALDYDVPANISRNYKMQIYGGQYKFHINDSLKNTSTGNTRNITNNQIAVGTYKLGTSDVRWDNIRALALDSNGNDILSGNLTTWHNWTDGNVTYQVVVNATTPANTNYSVYYRLNNTGDFINLASNQTGNQTIGITTQYQNTDVRVQLFGNETATPEIISITYYSQLSGLSYEVINSTASTCIDGGDQHIKIGVLCDNFNDNNFAGWNHSNVTGTPTWSVQNGLLNLSGNGITGYLNQNVSRYQNMRVLVSGYYFNSTAPNLTSYWDIIDLYGNLSRTSSPLDMVQATFGAGMNRTWIYCYTNPTNCGTINSTKTFPMISGQKLYVIFDVNNSAGSLATYNLYISNVSYEHAFSSGVHASGTNTTWLDGSTIQVGGAVVGLTNLSWDYVRAIPMYGNGTVIAYGTYSENRYSGSGNTTSQITINGTFPANTNFTLAVHNITTGALIESWGNLTENSTKTLSTSRENFTLNLTLFGNNTATPEISLISYALNESEPPADLPSYPPNPPVLNEVSWTADCGDFVNCLNFTWTANSTGNLTDMYNLSIEPERAYSNETNSTKYLIFNGIVHEWYNVSVVAINTTGTNSVSSPSEQTYQVPNTAPVLDTIGDKNTTEGLQLNFTITGSDADYDPLICGTNATIGSLTDCNFNWTAVAGTYYINFNVSDGWGGVAQENITIIVNASTNNVSFVFSNQSLTETQIYQSSQTTVISVDVNDSDGYITSVIAGITFLGVEFNYSMSGGNDTWTYNFVSGVPGTYTITHFYATDNSSGTNYTTSTLGFDVVPTAGTTGGSSPMLSLSDIPIIESTENPIEDIFEYDNIKNEFDNLSNENKVLIIFVFLILGFYGFRR